MIGRMEDKELTVTHDEASSRYEIELGGQKAVADYGVDGSMGIELLARADDEGEDDDEQADQRHRQQTLFEAGLVAGEPAAGADGASALRPPGGRRRGLAHS